MSYDPETEKQEIEEAFSALTHEFEAAQEEIPELVQKKKEEYDQKVPQISLPLVMTLLSIKTIDLFIDLLIYTYLSD